MAVDASVLHKPRQCSSRNAPALLYSIFIVIPRQFGGRTFSSSFRRRRVGINQTLPSSSNESPSNHNGRSATWIVIVFFMPELFGKFPQANIIPTLLLASEMICRYTLRGYCYCLFSTWLLTTRQPPRGYYTSFFFFFHLTTTTKSQKLLWLFNFGNLNKQTLKASPTIISKWNAFSKCHHCLPK